MRGLRVSDIDFVREVIRVRQQATDHRNLGEVKTPTSVRDIDLYPELAEILHRHLSNVEAHPWGLVFPHQRAVSTARLAHATPHDLRRTYGSILIASGADVTYVQTQLGHASSHVTLREYAGLWDRGRNRDRVKSYLNEIGSFDATN